MNQNLHSLGLSQDRQTAIIYPLLGSHPWITFFVVTAGAVVILALFAPSESAVCRFSCDVLNHVQALAVRIPEAKSLAESSAFPLATAVSYFAALVLGALTAVLIAFTKFKSLNLAAVRASGMRALILRLVAYGLWLAQFMFAAPRMNPQQFSYRFFDAVGSDRAYLLVWMLGIFVLSVATVLGMIVDIRIDVIGRRAKS